MIKEFRILLLDDQPTDSEVVVRELRQAQLVFTSKRVENKQEFLNALDEFNPDIIISDYGLAQFNGLEALRLLRELDFDIPFLLCTGALTEEMVVECMKEGAADYVLKSSLKRLPSAVRNALEKSASNRAEEKATVTLRESEERFRSIVETTDEWIWEIDLDGNSIYNNPAVEAILGYTPEELNGKSLLPFMYEEDRAEIEQLFPQFIAEKRGWRNLVCRWQHKDGSIRYMESSAVPVFDNGGEVTGFRGTDHDITKRKQTREELQKNVSLLTSTFEATADGILVVDLDNNIVTYNEKFVEMWEIPANVMNKNSKPVIACVMEQLKSPEDFLKKVEQSVEQPEVTDLSVWELTDGRIYERFSKPQILDGEIIGRVLSFRNITKRKQVENALRESEERFRSFMNNNPAVAFLKDEAGRYVYINETMERIFDLKMEDLLGRTDYDWLPEEAARSVWENDRKVIDSDKTAELLETIPLRDGSERKWLTFKFPVKDTLGNKFIGGTAIDITERERDKIALSESEYKLRNLVENMSEGLLQVDENEVIVFVNNRFCEMIGHKPEELVGKTTFDILLDEEAGKFVHEANRKRQKGVSNQYELRLKTKTGETLWTIVGGVPIFNADEEFSGTMRVITDITERKRAEEQLLHDAFHDGLTGLSNRTLFMDRLRKTIERGKSRHSNPYSVLFLDFDRFKIINDSLGHAEGDKLLKLIAKRLQSSVRPGDLVARLGGDEFVILLSELVKANEALLIAERIQNDLKTAFEVSGREIFISASIGVILSGGGHENADDMLRDADIAMYRAKDEGRANYRVFDQTLHDRASKQLQIETEMRQGLKRKEFEVHYQPIINLENESLVGFESLIRWKHPERGMISPLEFVPIAEENGLILPLGKWILHESCRQLREWQDKIPAASGLTICVNLSIKEFSQPDLAEQIAETLEKTGLDPHCLKIEITESHVMENSETAVTMMNRFRELGIELSLDDFGTGYSSLSHLHHLPVTFLKIDRSFVMRMADSKENYEIVSTIIKLAQNLKMKVIAEGIETADQLYQLKFLKCEYGQGNFFSKPLEAKKAKLFIKQTAENLIQAADYPIINVETNM